MVGYFNSATPGSQHRMQEKKKKRSLSGCRTNGRNCLFAADKVKKQDRSPVKE